MGRESLQGSSVHGPTLAPRTWNARYFARQRGAGVVEYMLISGFMLGALLTPFGQDDENALQRLVHAIRGQQDAYNYSAKLPVMPTFDADGKLVGGDEPAQEEPGPPPATDDTDEEASDGDDDAADQPDEGADDDASADEGSDSEGESSGDDASNGEGGGQDASEGGGSGGGMRENMEDLLLAVGGGYATWKFRDAVSEYICGQLDLQDANPVWTQEDIWAFEASDEAYDIDYESSEESFERIGVNYPLRSELEGFSAALVKKGDTWVLTFRGSDDFKNDWLKNNFPQPLFGSKQYDLAARLAQDVQSMLGDEEFLIAGHSLGGGLAQAASYATGMDAITFNAAGLNGSYKENGEGEQLESGNIRNHFIYGEFLTTTQKVLPGAPEADGEQIGHSASCELNFLDRHGIDSFHPPETPGPERTEDAPEVAYHSRLRELIEPRRIT